jgi:hypothetical protein
MRRSGITGFGVKNGQDFGTRHRALVNVSRCLTKSVEQYSTEQYNAMQYNDAGVCLTSNLSLLEA